MIVKPVLVLRWLRLLLVDWGSVQVHVPPAQFKNPNRMNLIFDSSLVGVWWAFQKSLGLIKHYNSFLVPRCSRRSWRGGVNQHLRKNLAMNTREQVRKTCKTPCGGCIENNSYPEDRSFIFQIDYLKVIIKGTAILQSLTSYALKEPR